MRRAPLCTLDDHFKNVEIEINGLLTYDRKVLKYNPSVLKAAHEKLLKAVADAAER